MMPTPRHDQSAGAQGPAGSKAASPSQGLFAWYAPGFSDGLGDRLLLFDNTNGRPLELLRLRPELAACGGFEFALRERAHELAAFDEGHFARLCRVDKLPEPGGGLAIVSEHLEGVRLSDMLAVAHARRIRLTPHVAMALAGDLVGGLAALHALGPHLAHGAVGPERLVLTPDGRLLITEYVLGLALRRLTLDRRALWHELRIAVPPAGDVPPFGQRTDVLQAGLTVLALLLARPLGRDDDTSDVPVLLDEAEERAQLAGCDEATWRRFRAWLVRLLSAGHRVQFAEAIEASRGLEDVLHAEPRGPDVTDHLARFVADAKRAEPGAAVLDDEATHPVVLLSPPSDTPAADDGPARPPLASGWQAALRRAAARPAVVTLLALVLLVAGVAFGGRLLRRSPGAGQETRGVVHLESSPSHASVLVDGKPSGLTPVTLRLAPGRHTLELVAGARRRPLDVSVQAGASIAQYVELPADAAGVGRIDVRSDPPGARVVVDGQPRGVTPVVVADLSVGEHQVRVESGSRSVVQSVKVADTQASAVFVPFPRGTVPLPGWLAFDSPVELQVYEGDQLLGTSRAERIMVPAGHHSLTLVSELIGFRGEREVQVPIGKTVALGVTLPEARLDINAAPWAEVWIDMQKVGDTPLASLPVTPGRHVVTFKHPALGERSVECVATLGQPTRVSVDLRK